MAAYLGSYGPEAFGGGALPRPGAVITQYTGHSEYTENDPPTYACAGTNDGIAGWQTMERRLQAIDALGIPTEFHAYAGLRHGFGLGTGTVAEGWIRDAAAFWEKQFVTPGTGTYRGFTIDNVLHAGENGESTTMSISRKATTAAGPTPSFSPCRAMRDCTSRVLAPWAP